MGQLLMQGDAFELIHILVCWDGEGWSTPTGVPHPSGASPLQDRHAVASGRAQSTGLHSDRDYHFFALKLKCVTQRER